MGGEGREGFVIDWGHRINAAPASMVRTSVSRSDTGLEEDCASGGGSETADAFLDDAGLLGLGGFGVHVDWVWCVWGGGYRRRAAVDCNGVVGIEKEEGVMKTS